MSILIKIDDIKKLYKKIISYIDLVRDYTSNNKFLNNLNLIDEIIHNDLMKSIDLKILSIDELFSIWHQIQFINNLFKLILIDLNDTSIINSNNISLELINEYYSTIILQYKKYKNNTDQNDIIIINEIFDQSFNKLVITNHDIIIDTVDLLTNLVKKYKYSVNLYSFIMQKIINECDILDKYKCDYILNQVELIKDFILLPDEKISNSKLNVIQSNAHLKSFGFVYFEESAKLEIIIKKFFIKSNLSNISIDKLDLIARKNLVCIVVINRVIKNPIEFDLSKLIDKNITKYYTYDKNMGINQTILDKFETITYNKIISGKKWNFNIDVYGSDSSDYFCILENINNTNYRVLNIINKENIIKLHKSKIPEFITYIKNKGVLPNHSRVTVYNNIHEKICLNNLFLPIKFSIENIKIKSHQINANDLRYNILIKFEKQFNKIFTTKFKCGNNLNNYKDLSELIHDNSFIDIFNDVLLNQYDFYELNHKNDTEFEISETLNTFLSILFNLTIDFRRLYHDFYIDIDIDIKILLEPNKIKYKKLLDVFMELSEKVLLRIINDTKNIYQSLIYKNEILNLNLY